MTVELTTPSIPSVDGRDENIEPDNNRKRTVRSSRQKIKSVVVPEKRRSLSAPVYPTKPTFQFNDPFTWPLSKKESNLDPTEYYKTKMRKDVEFKLGFDKNGKNLKNPWGNMSYAQLITCAIESNVWRRMTLSEICSWFIENIPYFNGKSDSSQSWGWKNSIRHNLSFHNRFCRVPALMNTDGVVFSTRNALRYVWTVHSNIVSTSRKRSSPFSSALKKSSSMEFIPSKSRRLLQVLVAGEDNHREMSKGRSICLRRILQHDQSDVNLGTKCKPISSFSTAHLHDRCIQTDIIDENRMETKKHHQQEYCLDFKSKSIFFDQRELKSAVNVMKRVQNLSPNKRIKFYQTLIDLEYDSSSESDQSENVGPLDFSFSRTV